MRLLAAEALRWWREPGQRAVLGVLVATWLVAALAGGLAARGQRAEQQAAQAVWLAQWSAVRGAAAATPSAAAAAMAFDLNRRLGPRIEVVGGPGLSLAPHLAGGAAPAIGIETRHFDARRTEALRNPLFAGLPRPGLALMIALLLPLGWIAMVHGLVLDDRAQGRWRWICVQARSPRRAVAAALLGRAGLLWAAAAGASAVGFALDPASTGVAFATWCAALTAFVTTWVVMAIAVTALPLSAAGGTLALLGLWVLTTFGAPAVAGALAQREAPMPSRLQALVEARGLQQAAEIDNDALLARWYADHRGLAPADRPRPAWPVSFVPRYLHLDAQLRPRLARFDAVRADQGRALQALSVASPPLALLAVAERTAGHDPARQAAWMDEVARREDTWRAVFVPAVMGYRGLTDGDRARHVDVAAPADPPLTPHGATALLPGALGALLLWPAGLAIAAWRRP